ncbi:MAG: ATP-binding cassette domain-containing protein [Nitrososphaerota archaeon]
MNLKAIVAQGLRKVFGGVVAVDNVSFAVEEKEIFGFLGPNGAGKTTTINILTTLTRPSAGRAEVGGYDVVESPDRVREIIGLAPQELTVDDELTGLENIMLQAALYHVPREEARRRAREILELFELERFANKKVETYSGGMKKRLELGCTLIHDPKILFLDEPTLGLDVQTRAAIWSYIKRLVEERDVTVFMTTHYMDEADSLCDRIAIIDRGMIRAIDSPYNLKSAVSGDIIELEISGPDGFSAQSLKALPGVVDIVPRKDLLVVKALRGEETLPTIVSELVKQGVGVRRVEMKRPTLDEVFLELTGKKLRDIEESREDAMRRRMTIRRMRS